MMAPMAITIQTPTIRDIEELFDIEKACFSEEAFSKKQILSLITSYNSISLSAIEQDQIVGFVIGTIYYERAELTGHILTIDIRETHRRKGVGTTLLQEMEKQFKEQGVTACRLEVREDNIPAIKFYEKLGYKKIAELENYYGKVNGLYLKKTLT
jgi:ribosomal-protein-alanine N-acetyltransferase